MAAEPPRMDAVPLPSPELMKRHGLGGAVVHLLKAWWHVAADYQRALYFTGFLMVLSGMVHTGVFVVEGGTWAGDVSWRKPIVFGFSFGITVITLAWVLTFFTGVGPTGGWLVFGFLGLASAGEVGLITMQRWRGVPSHFNTSTPFDEVIWILMGLLVGFIMVAVLVMTLISFRTLNAPRSLRWAIRAGMVLALASQGFGAFMVANESNRFGEAGVLQLPHAVSLHAVQVLPILALLLLFSTAKQKRQEGIVLLAAAGYTGLVAAVTYQVFSGRAPLDMDVPALVLHAGSLAALLAAGLAVLMFLGRERGASSSPPGVN